jgi:hypothetical protein
MHDGELKAAGINQHKSGWRDRLPVPRLDETTFIHRIFCGYFRSQVKCTLCGHKSNTYDPFLDLSLEVSRKSCTSVRSAIEEFTRQETLDSNNRWKCSGCKKRVCATKQLTVFRPPLSLCIQLKRFTFGGFGHFGSRPGGKKISKPIEFPTILDLPLSDARRCGYSLTGIVVHVGGSASSGHYTAYVKKPMTNGSEKWFKLDDSFVEPVPEKMALQQKDAYILFYSRREVKLEFPTPPLRSSMTAGEATKLGRSRARARAESLTDLTTSRSELAQVDLPVQIAAPLLPLDSTPGSNNAKVGDDQIPVFNTPNDFAASASCLTHSKIYGETIPRETTVQYVPHSDSIASNPLGSTHSAAAESNALLTVSEDIRIDDTGSTQSSKSISDHPDVDEYSRERLLDVDSYKAVETSSLDSESRQADVGTSPLTANTTVKHDKTRIVIDRDSGRERIKVMVGPRSKSNIWKPKTVSNGASAESFGLLGNYAVSQWDDCEIGDATSKDRSRRLLPEDNEERKRKRGLYASRWDSVLDQGKQKKVKSKPSGFISTDKPENNSFQRIQTEVQRMLRVNTKKMSPYGDRKLNRHQSSSAKREKDLKQNRR